MVAARRAAGFPGALARVSLAAAAAALVGFAVSWLLGAGAGLSALTAGIAGALAAGPVGAARDPLGRGRALGGISWLRIAAGLVGVSVVGFFLRASGAGFAALALLGGFAAAAIARVGLGRVGWPREGGAALEPELAQALAVLDAGPEHAPAALALLRERLAAADDPLAARALVLALRGRADAQVALAEMLAEATRAQRRETAIAAWRELTRLGAAPRASAELRTLAGWLRAAGAPGEARAAALASLAGASADEAARLAREARRADPVLAQRAAECALAAGAPGEAERRALEEIRAQAGKDARAAGVVALDAQAEATFEARRDARELASPSPTPDVSELAGDAGALRLDEPGEAGAPGDEGREPGPPEEPGSRLERRALESSEAEPIPTPDLSDPEKLGEDALLEALHQALTAEGGEPGSNDARAAADLEAPGGRGPGTRRLSHEDEPAREAASHAPAPRAEDFAFGAPDDEGDAPPQSPLRLLKVSAAKPLRLARDAIVLEIEGRGRAKLGYERIDAVAAAGVKGLSASGKAVLLIDLAIGFARGEGPLRVVRLRADGFDPRELLAGYASPLVALRALVAELRARTRAAALPREVDASAPFRIYADLASYEREAFGAERKS